MPPTSDKTLLSAVRNHLVAQSIVRYASSATPTGKPPMWIEPDPGQPFPGDALPGDMPANDAELTVALFQGGDLPGFPGGGHLLRTTVDVRYRCAKDKAARALDLDALIRAELTDTFGAKYSWTMAGLYVGQSQVWGGLGPLGSNEKGGSDFASKFYFEVLA